MLVELIRDGYYTKCRPNLAKQEFIYICDYIENQMEDYRKPDRELYEEPHGELRGEPDMLIHARPDRVARHMHEF